MRGDTTHILEQDEFYALDYLSRQINGAPRQRIGTFDTWSKLIEKGYIYPATNADTTDGETWYEMTKKGIRALDHAAAATPTLRSTAKQLVQQAAARLPKFVTPDDFDILCDENERLRAIVDIACDALLTGVPGDARVRKVNRLITILETYQRDTQKE